MPFITLSDRLCQLSKSPFLCVFTDKPLMQFANSVNQLWSMELYPRLVTLIQWFISLVCWTSLTFYFWHNCGTVTETHTMFLSPSFSHSLSLSFVVYFLCMTNNAVIVLPKQLLVMFEQCKIHFLKTRFLHVLRNTWVLLLSKHH